MGRPPPFKTRFSPDLDEFSFSIQDFMHLAQIVVRLFGTTLFWTLDDYCGITLDILDILIFTIVDIICVT